MERSDLPPHTGCGHLILVLLFLLHTSVLSAMPQKPASLAGTVTDSTGAVVAGATVTLTGGANVKLTSTSDAQGNYKFNNLASAIVSRQLRDNLPADVACGADDEGTFHSVRKPDASRGKKLICR